MQRIVIIEEVDAYTYCATIRHSQACKNILYYGGFLSSALREARCYSDLYKCDIYLDVEGELLKW